MLAFTQNKKHNKPYSNLKKKTQILLATQVLIINPDNDKEKRVTALLDIRIKTTCIRKKKIKNLIKNI